MATGDWLTVVRAGVAELVEDPERTPIVERDVCGRCSRTAGQVRLHAGHLGVTSR